MTTYAKLKYNPDIDTAQSTAIMCNCYTGLVLGYVRSAEEGVVEWRFEIESKVPATPSIIDETQYSSFVGDFGEWMDANNYRTACWEGSTNYDNMLARMEHSYLTWWFNTHNEIPLVPATQFKALVDNYLAVVPFEYKLHAGAIDLDDVMNEVGCNAIDRYSIGNMLTHFHSENWNWKAERMTCIAYKYDLDIHPMAIAMTPTMAATLRSSHNGS